MKKLKALKLFIINEGGATISPSTKKPADFKRGYMVSLEGYEKKVDIKSLKLKDIKKYIKLAKRLHAFAGFWIDNGFIYLDISKHFTSKDRACKYAIKNNQLALFDIYNNKSIYTTEFQQVKKSSLKYTF